MGTTALGPEWLRYEALLWKSHDSTLPSMVIFPTEEQRCYTLYCRQITVSQELHILVVGEESQGKTKPVMAHWERISRQGRKIRNLGIPMRGPL